MAAARLGDPSGIRRTFLASKNGTTCSSKNKSRGVRIHHHHRLGPRLQDLALDPAHGPDGADDQERLAALARADITHRLTHRTGRR